MPKVITADSRNFNSLKYGAMAQKSWEDDGLHTAIEEGKDWAHNIGSLNEHVRAMGGVLEFEEFKEFVNETMGHLSDGDLVEAFFDSQVEVLENQVVRYEGPDMNDNPVNMLVEIPAMFRILRKMTWTNKKGKKKEVMVDLTDRPHLTAAQTGGKPIYCEYWMPRHDDGGTGMEDLKRSSSWDRLFTIYSGDYFGIEGCRRMLQRMFTLARNTDKLPGLLQSDHDNATQWVDQTEMQIQKKERQVQKYLIHIISVLMDSYIAEKNWALFLDQTLSEEVVKRKRKAYGACRFEKAHQAVAVTDPASGEGVYCEHYAKMFEWVQCPDSEGHRDTSVLLEMIKYLRTNTWEMHIHVLFGRSLWTMMGQELNRLMDKKNPRKWNVKSADENKPKLGEIVKSERAKGMAEFFSQTKKKYSSTGTKLKKKSDPKNI